MSHRMLPYIGVTGLMGEELVQLNYLLSETEALKRGVILSAGILMSEKTLRGRVNKYPNKYPKREDVPKIIGCGGGGTINTIHYSTDSPETLDLQLMSIVGMFGGINTPEGRCTLNGFQLNVPWPTVECIKNFRDMCRIAEHDVVIILQVGSGALKHIGYSPKSLADMLLQYDDHVDTVLLDPSGGTGTPFNVSTMRGLLEAIHKNDRFRVGIAGGLCANALEGDVAQLLRDFPGTSIDAEGRIADENGRLSLPKARDYITKALTFFPEE